MRFLRLVLRDPAPPVWEPLAKLVPGRYKPRYFVSLTYPNVAAAVPDLPALSEGVDALELRVDLLRSWESAFVAEQVALLRRHSPLPIIYTVRSRGQGGRYPDDDEAGLFARAC